LTEQRVLDEQIDNSPLNRDSLTHFEHDTHNRQAKISFFRATDTRCMYMWIMQQSKIADKYTPAILKEIIDVLV